MVRAPVLIFSSRRLSLYYGSAVNVAMGGGGRKENSGVRGYRKIKVQLLQIKCRLQRQKKPQPKPKFKCLKLASQTSSLLTCIVAVGIPPENCAKEFRKQLYNKSKYTQSHKLQVTILNCKWRKFNVERSDKITIWKLLGLLFFSLIDCNAVLVSCCTSKPTNH